MAQRFVTAQRLRTRALRLAGSLFTRGLVGVLGRRRVYLTGFAAQQKEQLEQRETWRSSLDAK